MKRYSVTAKLWIHLDAQTEEDAQTAAKTIVDEALYDYVAANKKAPDGKVGISKAKIIWTKEEDKKAST